jgi:hypothetical protein
MINRKLNDRQEADLLQSGLSSETIAMAGFQSATAAEANQELGRTDLKGMTLKIPYCTLNGSPPFSRFKPDHPPLDKDGRPAKYLTAKGRGNRLYLPPNLPEGILLDTSRDLLITEGEKKALKATQEGLPCIGLAGVWCFRGKDKQGESRPIRDLDYIQWQGRFVYIVFDSDLADKPEVQRAESALAQELQDRGAEVRVARLPDGRDGMKVGLDDYLVQHGTDGPSKLRDLLKEAQPSVSVVSSLGGDNRENQWGDPLPLPNKMPPVEPFRMELLPTVFQPWIADVAERMQCPPDYSAVGAIVALGTVVGRQVAIRPKRVDEWEVVPNLWGAIVGRPSLMKTPALQEALRPLAPLEARAREEYDACMQDYEAHRLVTEAKQKHVKSEIQRALKAGGDAYEIAHTAQAKDEEMAPAHRRYRTNDPTVEKLGELLNENPRGLLVFRDELTGFLRNLDREGRETDRAFYLEAWNGTGRFVVDRIGRGTVEINAACVSILGGIQPGPLTAYMARTALGGSGDDGLMQRFQMAVWPDAPKHWRNVDTMPNSRALSSVREVFERLDRIDPRYIGAEIPIDSERLPFLRFSPEAQELFNEWRTELELRISAGDLHPMLEAHLTKYRSLIPSLALLIHLVDVGSGPIGPESLVRACGWAEYLDSHARRVYAPAFEPVVVGAKTLAEHIERGDLGTKFALREVYRKGWTGLADRKDALAALELLEDLEWVHRIDTGSQRQRRVSYLVNPKIEWAGKG